MVLFENNEKFSEEGLSPDPSPGGEGKSLSCIAPHPTLLGASILAPLALDLAPKLPNETKIGNPTFWNKVTPLSANAEAKELHTQNTRGRQPRRHADFQLYSNLRSAVKRLAVVGGFGRQPILMNFHQQLYTSDQLHKVCICITAAYMYIGIQTITPYDKPLHATKPG